MDRKVEIGLAAVLGIVIALSSDCVLRADTAFLIGDQNFGTSFSINPNYDSCPPGSVRVETVSQLPLGLSPSGSICDFNKR